MAFLAPGGKPMNAKSVAKQQTRNMQREARGLDRELTTLQREEKKLISEARSLASKGQMSAAKMVAKNIGRNRQQQQKMHKAKAQLNGVTAQVKSAAANGAMMTSMAAATNAMAAQNAVMNPAQMRAMAMNFEKQSMMMQSAEEQLDEAFDSIEDPELEDEADEEMNKVFDELNIDIMGQMGAVPTGAGPQAAPAAAAAAVDQEADDLMARMAALQGS